MNRSADRNPYRAPGATVAQAPSVTPPRRAALWWSAGWLWSSWVAEGAVGVLIVGQVVGVRVPIWGVSSALWAAFLGVVLRGRSWGRWALLAYFALSVPQALSTLSRLRARCAARLRNGAPHGGVLVCPPHRGRPVVCPVLLALAEGRRRREGGPTRWLRDKKEGPVGPSKREAGALAPALPRGCPSAALPIAAIG